MIGYHLSLVPNIRKFQSSKSGSGFGTNFYGPGLYVALDTEPIENWAEMMDADTYYVYEVEIPDTANILDDENKYWDVVAKYVDFDKEEPSNEDLRRASNYMVRKLGYEGLNYWNEEDGNAIVLWKPSVARIVSMKEHRN